MIFNSEKYCTYLTVYYGNKLPQFYIGSSKISKILKGYRGSVKSKKYSKTFRVELLNNPHLFKTFILNKYFSRKKALYRERILQTKLNVVVSSMYINMSIAKDFGWFGMDTSGENNHVYGKRWKKTKQQIENARIATKIAMNKPEIKNKMSEIRRGKLPLSSTEIEKRKEKYIKILNLYESKPNLEIPYGFIGKNGRTYTYERAFSIKYSSLFNMTPNGIHQILTKPNLIKNLL